MPAPRFSLYVDIACLIQIYILLGRVALIRGVAGYNHQTFPWTICRSVGPYVRACVRTYVRLSSALWKDGGSDPDAL